MRHCAVKEYALTDLILRRTTERHWEANKMEPSELVVIVTAILTAVTYLLVSETADIINLCGVTKLKENGYVDVKDVTEVKGIRGIIAAIRRRRIAVACISMMVLFGELALPNFATFLVVEERCDDLKHVKVELKSVRHIKGASVSPPDADFNKAAERIVRLLRAGGKASPPIYAAGDAEEDIPFQGKEAFFRLKQIKKLKLEVMVNATSFRSLGFNLDLVGTSYAEAFRQLGYERSPIGEDGSFSSITRDFDDLRGNVYGPGFILYNGGPGGKFYYLMSLPYEKLNNSYSSPMNIFSVQAEYQELFINSTVADLKIYGDRIVMCALALYRAGLELAEIDGEKILAAHDLGAVSVSRSRQLLHSRSYRKCAKINLLGWLILGPVGAAALISTLIYVVLWVKARDLPAFYRSVEHYSRLSNRWFEIDGQNCNSTSENGGVSSYIKIEHQGEWDHLSVSNSRTGACPKRAGIPLR